MTYRVQHHVSLFDEQGHAHTDFAEEHYEDPDLGQRMHIAASAMVCKQTREDFADFVDVVYAVMQVVDASADATSELAARAAAYEAIILAMHPLMTHFDDHCASVAAEMGYEAPE